MQVFGVLLVWLWGFHLKFRGVAANGQFDSQSSYAFPWTVQKSLRFDSKFNCDTQITVKNSRKLIILLIYPQTVIFS